MSAYNFLILQLRAPMASFGGAVVDNYGITNDAPTRSMLTGLLANALGWRRQDHGLLQRLQGSIRYAVRIQHPRPVRVWRDFQTVAIAKGDDHWTTSGVPAIRTGGSYDGPHLRYRDYLHDIDIVVSLGIEPTDGLPTVEQCRAALINPARPLFVGRKSCLPSAPLYREMHTARTALEALRQVTCDLQSHQSHSVQCYWMPSQHEDALPAAVMVYEVSVCDERDWLNNQHVGQRTVCSAEIPANWFEATH